MIDCCTMSLADGFSYAYTLVSSMTLCKFLRAVRHIINKPFLLITNYVAQI